MELIDMLKPDPEEDRQGLEYDLAMIRATADGVHDLPGGILAYRDDPEGWYSFACFEWVGGPSTRDGVIVDGEKMELVFHGHGGKQLRECRHTYWGHGGEESGYLFYMPGSLITAAIAKLGEIFDLS
jgi:hypothetical protein